MKKITNIPRIFLYVAIALLIFFLFRQCNATQEAKESKENVQNYLTDSISYYKNKTGNKVAQIAALKGEKKSLEILLKNTSENLKELTEKFNEVDAAVEVVTVTEYDTIEIKYDEPIDFSFVRKWEKDLDNLFISGVSTNFGTTINNWRSTDSLSIVIGDRDLGLFSSEYRIEATNTNPNVNIIGLSAYTIETSEGILSIGGQVGYGLTRFGTSFYVGVGVGFDFIRFIKNL